MNGTNCQENIEDIDDIMAEMEAKTPKPGDSKSFEIIFELQTTNISLQVPEVSLERPKSYDTIFAKKPAEEIVVTKVPDAVDAKGYWSKIFTKEPNKPGKTYPSMPTNERYYDFTHDRVGAALIFNQVKISGETERTGSLKDAKDLEVVLADIGFDVKVCNDFSIAEIKAELVGLSKSDHSDNDCLFVCIMTHGSQDGKVFGADGQFMVQELWENFIGDKCPSLIGKPKLFFIQACRGSMTDPGILYKPVPKTRLRLLSDTVDARMFGGPTHFVIPTLADLLVMYSTAEGYYSFRNPADGSWFIQALCEELRENSHEDLMSILTGVNRRVAFAKQSNIPHNSDYDAMKQMPNIVSMLTKTMYFMRKPLESKLEEA